MKLLERCFQELGGFFIFLFFITIAFATSSNIIDRNQYRDREIDLEKGDKTYDIDIY
jgi:4-hydroxybenzoate polyprenyltransferase